MNGNDVLSWTSVAYVVVVAVGVVVGLVLAPVAWDALRETAPEEPTVAVVTLRGETTDTNVAAVSELLREARNNASVEAVVVRLDSPGGPVDASEEFYLAVNRTAAEMPVVAYVEGAAASGGYYGIVPADEIYVKPSSNVGGIGIVVAAPLRTVEQAEQQRGTFVRSGPDKAQVSKDGIRQDLEALQASFVGSVMKHRGETLTISRQEVAHGDVYLGGEAVQNGFADQVGDIDAAIERAAQLSDGIEGDQYDVVYRGLPVVELADVVPEGRTGTGTVVYVEAEDGRRTEFVRPVEYYAVWGVPAPAENATGAGVVVDG